MMGTFKENLAEDFCVFRSDLYETLIYKRCTGTSFDPATGTETLVYSSVGRTAIRQALSTRLIAVSGGLYMPGDVVFLFKASELPAEPTRRDRIVYAGEDYEIREWVLEEDENVYRLVVRRL